MSDDHNEPLNQIFNLPVLTTDPNNSIVPLESQQVDKIEELYDADKKYARDNIVNIIEKGQRTLDSLINLAETSQNDKMFEALTKFMKMLVDSNKDLLSIHNTQKAEKLDKGREAPETINNSIFVGSTNDMSKILEQIKKNKEM